MEETTIAERLKETEIRTENNAENIEKLDKKVEQLDEKVDNLNKISTSIEVIATNMSYIKEDVSQVKENQVAMQSEIVELKALPDKENSKKWLAVVKFVGAGLGGAVLTYLITQLFPVLGA